MGFSDAGDEDGFGDFRARGWGWCNAGQPGIRGDITDLEFGSYVIVPPAECVEERLCSLKVAKCVWESSIDLDWHVGYFANVLFQFYVARIAK